MTTALTDTLIAEDPFELSLPATTRWVEPVTRVIAGELLDASALPSGARVLDVGAGSGPLTISAAHRGLQVSAIDTSPLLINHINGRLTSYREGASAEVMDVMALKYADDTFEAAFSVFTVMFLGPGVPTALSELLRVLRPGGTLQVVHWAAVDGSPLIRILSEAAADIGSPIEMPFEYLEPAELTGALTAAGFTDVQVRPYTADYPFPPAEDVLLEFQSFYLKLPPFRALSPAQRAELEEAMTLRARAMENGERPRPALRAQIAQAWVPAS
jgi:SAM-dependent methyltransferase